MTIIRQATLDDVPSIVEMGRRFLAETPYGLIMPFDAARVESVAVLLITQLGVVVIADYQHAGDAIGMLALAALEDPLTGLKFADEMAWWVDPEHRHSTVGPKLLWHAEEWARRKGLKACKMVAPAGTTIGTFYERVGYVPVETAYRKVL